MRNLFLAAGTALMLAGTTSAWAETLKFSYSGTSFPNNDPATATWFQPSDPVPIFSEDGSETTISVTGGSETNNGVPSTVSVVTFENQFNDGGFITNFGSGSFLQVVGRGWRSGVRRHGSGADIHRWHVDVNHRRISAVAASEGQTPARSSSRSPSPNPPPGS